jgi:hypothetical protein
MDGSTFCIKMTEKEQGVLYEIIQN